MPAAFRYNSLNSTDKIRLLTLLPKPGKTVHVSLNEVNLNDVKEQFAAISYVWGSEDPPRHVMVNSKQLQVRENIWQCLKHLRRHNLIARPLWIDCICINQKNRAEKAEQVAKMSRIFSSASTVYIWLGRISRLFQPDQNPGHALLRNVLKNPSLIRRLESIFLRQDSAALMALDLLMHLVYGEYWHRLWIVQEVALASDTQVIIGDMFIDRRTLSEICIHVRDASKPVYYSWLRRQSDPTFEDRGTAILDTHPIFSIGAYQDPHRISSMDLASLIRMSKNKICADPRDCIYGLLGMTNSIRKPVINYSISNESLLMETIQCLYDAHQDSIPSGQNQSEAKFRFDPELIAYTMQLLDVTARTIRSAIMSSYSLLKLDMQLFQMEFRPYELIQPRIFSPTGELSDNERYTFIQPPSGQVEHFSQLFNFFGFHRQKKFRMEAVDSPLLICTVGLVIPVVLLSINEKHCVRVERLLYFDTSRGQDEVTQYRSRDVPNHIVESLNRKLNLLDVKWEEVFSMGLSFDSPISLSGIELIEMAETCRLSKISYNPED